MKIATNEALFRMTCQLWQEAYHCNSGEHWEDSERPNMISDCVEEDKNAQDSKDDDFSFKWHPFGEFECNKGFMYIDRIGYRIPTKLAETIGKQLSTKEISQPTLLSTNKLPASSNATKPTPKKKKKKPKPIQRSLTPHFDCCPEKYHDTANKNKWRPIQCFVSLTDNLQPNTGGFEAAPGFHREFRSWVENGRQFDRSSRGSVGSSSSVDNIEMLSSAQTTPSSSPPQQHPQPCVGEYTHLNPTHDRELMQRVQHVPVKAGSVVFWDNRIPHSNSYRNDPIRPRANDTDEAATDDIDVSLGTCGSRAVVYCSFLPDVQINRRFVARQLEDWKMQRAPRVGDRWMRRGDDDDDDDAVKEDDDAVGIAGAASEQLDRMTELEKRLIGLAEWT
mmetsp:Transcript_26880/g.56059  ORF Transcript_26880/g.56059 Transcript_26880/m.56059 type:complete len:391 (-) Transcript_26880:71-1243(-)